jgi:hypothetical protein
MQGEVQFEWPPVQVPRTQRDRAAGGWARTTLRGQPVVAQRAFDIGDVAVWRQVEGQAGEARRRPLLKHDGQLPRLTREKDAARFPPNLREADDIAVVGELPLNVRCDEGEMPEALHRDHGRNFWSRRDKGWR